MKLSWKNVGDALQMVVGLLFICGVMPYLLTSLYPPIATSLVVRLWPVWLIMFGGGISYWNNLPQGRKRMAVGMATGLPCIFLAPIALYHGVAPYITSLIDLCA